MDALDGMGAASGLDAIVKWKKPTIVAARGKSHCELVGDDGWVFCVGRPRVVLVHCIGWNALGSE